MKRFSPWVICLGLLGAAALFEKATYPWSHPTVLPTPYTMFYGIITFVAAIYGYRLGITISLLWYFGVIVVQAHWFHNPPALNLAQAARLALQIAGPALISQQAAKRRKAEHQRAQLLDAMATGVPHEFNNLFMIVMAASEELRGEISLARRKQLADDLLDTAQRGAELVRAIKHHAKVGQLSPELLRVTDLLDEIKVVQLRPVEGR